MRLAMLSLPRWRVRMCLTIARPEPGAVARPALRRRRRGRSARSGAGDARARCRVRNRAPSGPPPFRSSPTDTSTSPAPASGRTPYLMAFSIRFSATRSSSSRSPLTSDGLGRAEPDFRAQFLRHRRQRVDDAADRLGEIDDRLRPKVLLLLDARQGQQVLDQPGHASPLIAHDGEEAVARLARRLAPSPAGSR